MPFCPKRKTQASQTLPHPLKKCFWGEGNGNPFQCFCLENPRDGGARWAASMGSHRVGHDWSDLAEQQQQQQLQVPPSVVQIEISKLCCVACFEIFRSKSQLSALPCPFFHVQPYFNFWLYCVARMPNTILKWNNKQQQKIFLAVLALCISFPPA